MKLVTINHTELYNYALLKLLEYPLSFNTKPAYNINIEINLIEAEILAILDKLNKIGQRKNIQFLVIGSPCIAKNISIESENLDSIYNVISLMVDNIYRDAFYAAHIILPRNSRLECSWEKINKQKYNNIKFINLQIDHNLSKLYLKKVSPIEISDGVISDFLEKPTRDYNLIIDAYDFYNNKYDISLISNITYKMDRILKTQANSAISAIFN